MTLREMSAEYRRSAALLSARLRELRQMEKHTHEPDELFLIQRRKAVLTVMLGEMNELAELTLHYYERGYTRNEKYKL